MGDELYLGLSIMFGREKKQAFRRIIYRIRHRIGGWNAKLLSQAGKGTLIRSVVQSIPTYSMCCFKMPKGVISDINRLTAGFWWGDKGEKKKIHWLNWQRLCWSKLDGGQGFREIEAFNMAMLAKQWRRLLNDESLLSYQVLKAMYFPYTSMCKAVKGRNASYLWRSLLEGKEVVEEGAIWRVGDGRSIEVWADKWVPGMEGNRIVWPHSSDPPIMHVDKLIQGSNHGWKLPMLQALLSREEAEAVSKIRLGRTMVPDKLIWNRSQLGLFSVRSAYFVACEILGRQVEDKENRSKIWKIIWSAKVPRKIINFMWRLVHGILPTGAALRSRTLSVDVSCGVCGDIVENAVHSIFYCRLSKEVWHQTHPSLASFLDIYHANETFYVDWLERLSELNLVEVGLTTNCWLIWKNRNQVRHENKCDMVMSMAARAKQFHSEYVSAVAANQAPRMRVVQNAVWKRPSSGRIKLNVDASLNRQNGIARLGATARDENGSLVFYAVHAVPGVKDVMLAELMTILFGLEMAKDCNLGSVEVESDSLLSIEEIHCGEKTFNPWGGIIFDILALSFEFNFCAFMHVARQANCLGHKLAKTTVELGQDS